MKLTYYRGREPNFGDELNATLWEKLMPGVLDDDGGELFLGVGSIINDSYPQAAKKIVMGSGYSAGYSDLPDTKAGDWEFVFVRGPRTAWYFNLPPDKAICDSAILVRALSIRFPPMRFKVAFMPHHDSLWRGLWPEACQMAGIDLIDPRDDPWEIAGKLLSTDLLISEAMHGAIVADALRTPWIAVRPIHDSHHGKWFDWADALGIALRFHDLAPSSAFEWWTQKTGRGSRNGRMGKLSRSSLARPFDNLLVERAAEHLQGLAKAEPQMSRDDVLDSVTERALDALHAWRQSRGRGQGST